ncbi:MAG: hypothetical protein JWO03_3972 [Bacteroidetes bacterium]|nr:hypothetical protein [Bacteroidota bacterium]
MEISSMGESPEALPTKVYSKLIKDEFEELLLNHGANEKAFQRFFERNPCYLPGSRGEFDPIGQSGHGPHLKALITQPELNGLVRRNPDFLWFAWDSVVLSPILIEIEAPDKNYFTKTNKPTSDFTQARHQLSEWRAILSMPENKLKFLSQFNLPASLRNLVFDPYYVLIYGRRSEYENDPWRTQQRYTMVSRADHEILMSYDRLKPFIIDTNLICCEVKGGKYFAKHLSPTFDLDYFDLDVKKLENLEIAIDVMQHTSPQRKLLLKKKLMKTSRSKKA